MLIDLKSIEHKFIQRGANKQLRKMKCIFRKKFFVSCILILQILTLAAETVLQPSKTNLTNWREHRRQKRFILFENAGISKLVTGITYPVDLSDKRPWRQLVLTFNLQYQFPVPPRPIYYWDKWDEDRAVKEISNVENLSSMLIDEAQMFLYEFAVELLNKKGINGRACLQHAICENAQLNGHDGLFAEIVYRLLTPHKSLDAGYVDAFNLGREGFNCKTAFPEAKYCILDQYLHIRDEVFEEGYNLIS